MVGTSTEIIEQLQRAIETVGIQSEVIKEQRERIKEQRERILNQNERIEDQNEIIEDQRDIPRNLHEEIGKQRDNVSELDDLNLKLDAELTVVTQSQNILSPNMPRSVKRTFTTLKTAKTFQVKDCWTHFEQK